MMRPRHAANGRARRREGSAFRASRWRRVSRRTRSGAPSFTAHGGPRVRILLPPPASLAAGAHCAGSRDGDERCRPRVGAAPASRHQIRRVDYGLEGTPRRRATGFSAATVWLCAPGFGCGTGRRRSAGRASARSDTGGTPAPGARTIHVNEYRIDHPVRKLGTRPAREPSPIHQPVAPGCRRKSGRRIRSRFGRSGSSPRPGRSP
jgi:hypothetical protein